MSDIQFKYFYGKESELFTFYRIPKELITNPRFKSLSNDAKLLYGLMLDRMALSAKNKWFDKYNRVYIYFSVVDVMEQLNIGRNKAIKLFKELDDESGIGLIEKKQQGQEAAPSMRSEARMTSAAMPAAPPRITVPARYTSTTARATEW